VLAQHFDFPHEYERYQGKGAAGQQQRRPEGQHAQPRGPANVSLCLCAACSSTAIMKPGCC
jgi:hypothetical protein